MSKHNTQRRAFYKNKKTDQVYWIESKNLGQCLFSFDKKKIYNLFADYPHNLSAKEVAIFDKENPYWANFFRDRKG